MFTKWLIKALKRRLAKMSVDEQNAVRELGESAEYQLIYADEPKSETKHKSHKKSKRRIKTMADEKEVEKKVETSKVDEKTENNEVDKEKSTDKVDKSEEKVDETKKEVEIDKKEDDTSADDEEPTAPEVADTEPVGNGIPISDLVTKEELAERFAAFEAKYEAVVKENVDLKEKLSKSEEENTGLKDKYENKDFGNFNRPGVMSKDKDANETFESYSKSFM